MSLNEVLALCGQPSKGFPPVSHLKKQEAAQVTTAFRGSAALPMKRMMEAGLRVQTLLERNTPPDDPAFAAAAEEYRTAEAEYESQKEIVRREALSQRHVLRERGLYVDIAREGGKVRWKRPNEISADEAKIALEDALNEYGLACDHLAPERVEDAYGPALAAALAGWPEKPQLPSPFRLAIVAPKEHGAPA